MSKQRPWQPKWHLKQIHSHKLMCLSGTSSKYIHTNSCAYSWRRTQLIWFYNTRWIKDTHCWGNQRILGIYKFSHSWISKTLSNSLWRCFIPNRLSKTKFWELCWLNWFPSRTFRAFLFDLWRICFLRCLVDKSICSISQELCIYLVHSIKARVNSYLGWFTKCFSCPICKLKKKSVNHWLGWCLTKIEWKC